MGEPQAHDLDRLFRVLSDGTRRGILERLAVDPAALSVTELAEPYDMSLAAVSKHLKALERAGLVERSVAGREHRFRFRGAALAGVHRWLSAYERFWTERLDALEALLDEDRPGPHPRTAKPDRRRRR